jgi:hypothetical protein
MQLQLLIMPCYLATEVTSCVCIIMVANLAMPVVCTARRHNNTKQLEFQVRAALPPRLAARSTLRNTVASSRPPKNDKRGGMAANGATVAAAARATGEPAAGRRPAAQQQQQQERRQVPATPEGAAKAPLPQPAHTLAAEAAGGQMPRQHERPQQLQLPLQDQEQASPETAGCVMSPDQAQLAMLPPGAALVPPSASPDAVPETVERPRLQPLPVVNGDQLPRQGRPATLKFSLGEGPAWGVLLH